MKKAVDEKDKERAKALEAKTEELERKYDTVPIRRQIAEAQTAVAGTQSHLVLGWLGRLLLVAGLLVLMLQSEGLRQKVILVVLLIVMFIALSGVDLDLGQGHMGGSSNTAPRVTERTPEAHALRKLQALLERKSSVRSGSQKVDSDFNSIPMARL